jgi:hypothetical protein
MSVNVWPDGKPVETLATRTPVPPRASFAMGTSAGYTHTAATEGTEGSPGSGRTALAHNPRTLPGVSFPSSVVRSIIRMTISSAHTFEASWMARVRAATTRSTTPTWSTPPMRSMSTRGDPSRPTQARTSAAASASARVRSDAGASTTLLMGPS